jgi:hypothetical protein
MGERMTAAILAILISAAPAAAQRFALEIEDFPSARHTFNHIVFRIENLSPTQDIVAFAWEAFGPVTFDGPVPLTDPRSQVATTKGVTMRLLRPDYDQGGGIRSKVLELAFDGFAPGMEVRMDVDIDRERSTGAGSIEDARRLLWNNGKVPNATVTATFSDGAVVTGTLPDGPDMDRYRFVFPDVIVPSGN